MTIEGQILPAHTSAYREINLYPIAVRVGLPVTSFAVPAKRLTIKLNLFGTQIVYRLYPNCRKGQTAEPQVVFYVAFNEHKKRNEYVIGPSQVPVFDENVKLLCIAAGNFFGFSGYVSNHDVASGAVISSSINGQIEHAFSLLGESWISALQDPAWWVVALGANVGAAQGRRAAPFPSSAAGRVANPTSYPAVARALRTQTNLQELPITRSVQLIEQPTVFRHTVTADVKPASFARIEKYGELRLSDGAKAHYGEGVYAWPKDAKGIGKYIDIEVPPGIAVELIQTPAGTWYRLVPPEGQVLKVRVVGHNFTPDEVKMGRMLGRDE